MDFFQLWDQILDYIDQYDHPYYDMFSNEVFPISMTENTLTISPKTNGGNHGSKMYIKESWKKLFSTSRGSSFPSRSPIS